MSAVVGIAMVRDEDDIIGDVVQHMLAQVDALIIADNLSTDHTGRILELIADHNSNLVVYLDDEVGYQQSLKMSALARLAHEEFGAEWIVPFDADEVWYAPTPRLGDFLRTLPPGDDIVRARLFDHVCTGRDDPTIASPTTRIQWRRSYVAPLPKVACRYRDGLTIEMGNHGANYQDLGGRVSDRRIAVRHFPYRSPEQVVRKVRNGAEAYAATDLPEHFGAHWRQWGRILDLHGEDAIHDLFHTWYFRDEPDRPLTIEGEIQGPLLCDPAPVRR